MDIYLKSFTTFNTTAHYEVSTYNLYLGSATDSKGSVVIPKEVNDCTGCWLIADGRVWFVTGCTPKDGVTKLAVADPVDAFNRTVMFYNSKATAGAKIKDSLNFNFTYQEDSDFASPYLEIVDSSTVAYFEPELSDGTYNLAEYIKTAINAGVNVAFTVHGSNLKITLSDAVRALHKVSFKDGFADLVNCTFASDARSKLTVRKPTEDSTDYVNTTFYLSAEGGISTTAPAHRAHGRWETVVCTADEDPQEKAEEIFGGNKYSYKVEFYSRRKYALFDSVLLMLPSGNVSVIISEVSISSTDNRYHYQCGEMSTTVSDTVQAVNSTISSAAQVAQNTTALAAYPVGSIYMSVLQTSPAALFGGCWERVQGRFLLGASSDYTAGTTGGEAQHTLTIDEMPAHTHSGYSAQSGTAGKRGSTSAGNVTGSTGGGQPHNNMPPYLAVYIWKRTG